MDALLRELATRPDFDLNDAGAVERELLSYLDQKHAELEDKREAFTKSSHVRAKSRPP
jgi:hypothetical protein